MNDSPTSPPELQGELDFAAGGAADGHAKWVPAASPTRSTTSNRKPHAVLLTNDSPNPPAGLQGGLEFDATGAADGHAEWVALRRMSTDAAARQLNLPVGHPAEVWLRGGIRLRGTLRLLNEILFIEEERVRQLPLVLDGVPFTYAEIESCVRLD